MTQREKGTSVPHKIIDLKFLREHPQGLPGDTPVILMVDPTELVDGGVRTVHDIETGDVYVRKLAEWDGRVYDEEDDFVEAYVGDHLGGDADEPSLCMHAHDLWDAYAVQCVVCYTSPAILDNCVPLDA